MTLDLEKYTFTDGKTDLSAAELNPRLYAIVRRLHALELLSIDWAAAVSAVQNYGLARINDAVQPLIDGLKIDLTNLIAQGRTNLASQSAAVDAKLASVDAKMAEIEAQIQGFGIPVASASNAGQMLGVSETGAYKLFDPVPALPVVTASNAGAGLVVSPAGGWALGPVFGLDTSAEVSVSAATALTSSAFGKQHVCSGTSADYPVTLPTAVGHVGKLIGVRIANACTKLITLTATGGQLIDGAASRVMWAGESAILLSDGTGWTKIVGKSIPMTCKLTTQSMQSIPVSAATTIKLDVIEIDSGGLADVTNSRAITRRTGKYFLSAHMSMSGSPKYCYGFAGSLSLWSDYTTGLVGSTYPMSFMGALW